MVVKEVAQALADGMRRGESEPLKTGHVGDVPPDAGGAIVPPGDLDLAVQSGNAKQLGKDGVNRRLASAREVVHAAAFAPSRKEEEGSRDVANVDEIASRIERPDLECRATRARNRRELGGKTRADMTLALPRPDHVEDARRHEGKAAARGMDANDVLGCQLRQSVHVRRIAGIGLANG